MAKLIKRGSEKFPALLGGGILGIATVGSVWHIAAGFMAIEAFGIGFRLAAAGAGALLAARYT